MVAAVLGEATFSRFCRCEVRLFGVRYDVDVYEEARPNAFYSRYSGWGHIAPHCEAAGQMRMQSGSGHRRPRLSSCQEREAWASG